MVKAWQLNERHYGALQGLNKADMARQYGDAQVLVWRRSYDTPPPALEASDPRSERADPRYSALAPEQVPLTECLKDTVARVLPFWHATLAPAIRSGQRVLVAAHGNSMRALVKYLDGISDDDIYVDTEEVEDANEDAIKAHLPHFSPETVVRTREDLEVTEVKHGVSINTDDDEWGCCLEQGVPWAAVLQIAAARFLDVPFDDLTLEPYYLEGRVEILRYPAD